MTANITTLRQARKQNGDADLPSPAAPPAVRLPTATGGAALHGESGVHADASPPVPAFDDPLVRVGWRRPDGAPGTHNSGASSFPRRVLTERRGSVSSSSGRST